VAGGGRGLREVAAAAVSALTADMVRAARRGVAAADCCVDNEVGVSDDDALCRTDSFRLPAVTWWRPRPSISPNSSSRTAILA